jgi:DNA-binding LacI/PurR family transcriptional regulator
MQVQAIVASNDRMAFGVLEMLQQRGIRVPETIALTGFDDVKDAQSMGVPLTTVHQSFYEAGRRAFDALYKRMNGEAGGEYKPPPIRLGSALVMRLFTGKYQKSNCATERSGIHRKIGKQT